LFLRVGASVSHGQQTRLGVLQLEVLIAELLAVDGLATSALLRVSIYQVNWDLREINVRCHG
jgi:hypothetical protein